MLQIGDDILLSITDDGTAGLPGEIVECHDSGWTADFELEDFEPAVGREAVMAFKHDGEFKRQKVRIEGVERIGITTGVRLEPTQAAGAAELRRHTRHSTVNTDALITFGDEPACPLLDVSTSGLSLMAGAEHTVGETVVVRLEINGEAITWPVIVRSVREVWEGRFRYGLECDHAGVDLAELLARLGAAIDR